MSGLIDILGALLMVGGGAVVALAALGVARLPLALMRMHAATKAGVLGAGLILLGAALAVGGVMSFVKGLAALVFLFATAPIASHVLGRAAHREAEAAARTNHQPERSA